MFNLRQLNPNRSQLGSSAEQHRNLPTLRFSVHSDFLGNIGAPLDHGQSKQAVAEAECIDLNSGPLCEDDLMGRSGQRLEHAVSNLSSAFHADRNGEATTFVSNAADGNSSAAGVDTLFKHSRPHKTFTRCLKQPCDQTHWILGAWRSWK
jgi:hypothetical protein